MLYCWIGGLWVYRLVCGFMHHVLMYSWVCGSLGAWMHGVMGPTHREEGGAASKEAQQR